MITIEEIETQSGLNLKTLDEFPIDVILAQPEFIGDNLVNLEIVWANQKLLHRGKFQPVGLKLTQVYPHLLGSEWMTRIQKNRNPAGGFSTPDKSMVFGPSQIPYELTTFWTGDLLYAHVNELNPHTSIEEGLPYALQLIFSSIANLPLAMSFVTEKSRKRFASSTFLEAFNVSKEEFEALDFEALVHAGDLEKFNSWMLEPLLSSVTLRICHNHAEGRWVDVSASQILDLAGNSHGLLYSFVDVHEQLDLANSLAKANQHNEQQLKIITSALDVSRDGFAIWSKSNNYEQSTYTLEFINDAGAAPTGQAPQDLVGKDLYEVLPNEGKLLSELFEKALDTSQQQIDVVEVDSEAGWIGAYENRVVPIAADKVVANFRDVSNERQETKRLEWLVTHDYLTGLINRRGLEDAIQGQLEKIRTSRQGFGFAFVDLDDFKAFNDNLGHEAGDLILKAFGEELSIGLGRGRGHVSRISGDEFALIIDFAESQHECEELLANLQILVRQSFAQTMNIGVTFSAGIVWVSDGAQEIDEVLRVADKAMYQAKHDGKNCFKAECL